MKKKKKSRVSIRDIARAAGISISTASCALRNQPKVDRSTRQRVLRIAEKLGYIPDANMASFMATVRLAKAKELQAIAWLNSHPEKDAWQRYKFFSPYLEGAQERALKLGYRLDQIWAAQPGMTMPRISQILYQRGIQGAIFTQHRKHFHVNWDHLAGVSLEGSHYAPSLHRVASDMFFNFLVAIKMLKRFGYRRLGICLEDGVDRRCDGAISAMAHRLDTTGPKSKNVPPLFYGVIYKLPGQYKLPAEYTSQDQWETARLRVQAWARRYRPDVVVGHSSWLVSCLEEAGFRVPQDIGVVHLAIDDDVIDWAGIYSNRKEVGAAATELLVSLMQTRQFGAPKIAMHTFIRGEWRPGKTLLIPKMT